MTQRTQEQSMAYVTLARIVCGYLVYVHIGLTVQSRTLCIGSHYVACWALCVRTITMYMAWSSQHVDREHPLLHQTSAIADRSVHRQFANNRDIQSV